MHWSDKVIKILEAKTGSLKELAEIAGYDPAVFYRHQSLAGCDIRGQDLRGMDLTGCDLERAIYDESTIIDPKFDPRLLVAGFEEYLYGQIPQDINTMLLSYIEEVGYTYPAWAHKKIFERGAHQIQMGRVKFYYETILRNPHLNQLITLKGRRKSTVRILTRLKIEEFESEFSGHSRNDVFCIIMLFGLISRKIDYRDKKDYSNVSINAFYPPKYVKVEGSQAIPSIDD